MIRVAVITEALRSIRSNSSGNVGGMPLLRGIMRARERSWMLWLIGTTPALEKGRMPVVVATILHAALTPPAAAGDG